MDGVTLSEAALHLHSGKAIPLAKPLEPEPWCKVYTSTVKIGELAKAAGVKIATIRFYERRRLLKPPPRTASGYRAYTQRDVDAIKGIRSTQELGFTLREIRELLDLHRTMRSLCDPVVDASGMKHAMAMTQEKLRTLDHKAQAIRRMRRDLLRIAESLRSAAGKTCPFAQRKKPAQSAQRRCPANL